MRVGIMQPYFFPYIGYWQLISAVDTFVIYDDVNYIKQGFVNRNSLIINGTKSYFTLELKGASPNKFINEILIGHNKKKLLKTVEFNYKKTPLFSEVFPFIQEIFEFQNDNLGKFLGNSIEKISAYLEVKTKFIYSSNLKKDNRLKGKDKVISICKILDSTHYLNASGGHELYDKSEFLSNGIKLNFIKSKPITYKQFDNEFIPWLSIIDIMMFNSPDTISGMLKEYYLI
jgi:hypothetical protein